MRNVIVGAAVLAIVNAFPPEPATQLEVSAGELSLPTCTRLTRASIGALPLEVELGGQRVRFREWTLADELSTEPVGFAAEVPAGVSYTVEAGGRTFHGASPRWLHPSGVSGPRSHGIDGLTLCAVARAITVASTR